MWEMMSFCQSKGVYYLSLQVSMTTTFNGTFSSLLRKQFIPRKRLFLELRFRLLKNPWESEIIDLTLLGLATPPGISRCYSRLSHNVNLMWIDRLLILLSNQLYIFLSEASKQVLYGEILAVHVVGFNLQLTKLLNFKPGSPLKQKITSLEHKYTH